NVFNYSRSCPDYRPAAKMFSRDDGRGRAYMHTLTSRYISSQCCIWGYMCKCTYICVMFDYRSSIDNTMAIDFCMCINGCMCHQYSPWCNFGRLAHYSSVMVYRLITNIRKIQLPDKTVAYLIITDCDNNFRIVSH